MELLLSKNPTINKISFKSTSDYINQYITEATDFNIATGFISNESLVRLKDIIEYRNSELNLNLFIGMNYLNGFTKLQYNALLNLNSLLKKNNSGKIYLSRSALFHGKMYSFLKRSKCLGSFVGSSNLGSFVNSNQNYIESDVLLCNEEGMPINNTIKDIILCLGSDLEHIPTLTEFKEPEIRLLDGYRYVEKIPSSYKNELISQRTGVEIVIPLKTEEKSNLNAYFGAGKIKGRYSPRGWYEVELIISKKIANRDLLPDKESGPFTVITSDGYKFDCERQGDFSKNFRSSKDLKILGRWIKGQMENSGALHLGEHVTNKTLESFGKNRIIFEQTTSNIWLISLR